MQASVMSELLDKVLSKYISCEWVKKKKTKMVKKNIPHNIRITIYNNRKCQDGCSMVYPLIYKWTKLKQF